MASTQPMQLYVARVVIFDSRSVPVPAAYTTRIQHTHTHRHKHAHIYVALRRIARMEHHSYFR